MEKEEKVYNVMNRSIGTLSYKLPDLNVRRIFMPGETKRIKESELEALSYIDGGRTLMREYLQIQDIDFMNSLDMPVEPEYSLSKEEIIDLMLNGSLEAFLDCLDFAPNGVLDIIKRVSVSLPLNDVAKRQALKEKTGFDVDLAIKNSEEEKPKEVKAQRRVEEEEENLQEGPKVRRTEVKYKTFDNK